MEQEVKLYFEIDRIGFDEDGSECSAGMCLSMEGEGYFPDDYEELRKLVHIDGLLRMIGMEGAVSEDMVRIITPEEYARKYGDEDDE